MTTTEAEKIAQIRAWQVKASAVNTNPPAGFEATCPQCHQPSHKTLVGRWVHCMACHRAAHGV